MMLRAPFLLACSPVLFAIACGGSADGPPAQDASSKPGLPTDGGAAGCTPSCAGKGCGDDGCGGTCGACTAPASCGGAGVANQCGIPTGNGGGIAAKHPGDVGIASDPDVIFADDFESYGNANGLTGAGRWNELIHAENARIATEAANVFGGGKSLELTLPLTNGEISNEAVKYIQPNVDKIHLRFYAKFDAGFDVVDSSHNGGMIQASYWDGPGSGPGIPADGSNKFLVSYEAWRGDPTAPNPGRLNVYIYHPEQRDVWGDHFFPTGKVLPFDQTPGDFGTSFVARPDVTPELGRWYCYEIMVKANTPGQRDGQITLWLDGAVIADFSNLRLRDTATLKIDRIGVDLHGNGGILATSKKWYDDVVVARSYVGPRTAP